MTAPRVLIVGAGAVGQGYGLALARAGAEVHFFVKPHHEEGLAAGMPIRELSLFASGPLTDLRGHPRITDWQLAARQDWQSIWLAVDSTALTGAWVSQLGTACGKATVVRFQTGTTGIDALAEHVPRAQLVSAMIPFVAWWAPLTPDQQEADGPHMRVWHPPLMATPLSGAVDRAHDIASLLRAGGLRARLVPNASVQGAMGSAILLPTIAGLEVAGWRLRALRSRPGLDRMVAAVREAQQITGAVFETPVVGSALIRPAVFQLATHLAPPLAPLDLETYLRVHFTKVGAQTRAALTGLVEAAHDRNLPCSALEELLHALQESRRT